MTNREKAFAINGYVGFVMLKEHASPRVGGQLASLGAEYAAIPLELVGPARDESEVLTKIVILALRWPMIGRWLARRALARAQARGAIAMTDREKALVLDNIGRMAEWRTRMAHTKAAEMVASAAWKVGIEYDLVAQLSQESAAFIGQLGAAIRGYDGPDQPAKP